MMRTRTTLVFSLVIALSAQAMQDEQTHLLPAPDKPITLEQLIQNQLQQSSGIKRCLFAAADACMALKYVASASHIIAQDILFTSLIPLGNWIFAKKISEARSHATNILQAAARARAAEEETHNIAASILNSL